MIRRLPMLPPVVLLLVLLGLVLVTPGARSHQAPPERPEGACAATELGTPAGDMTPVPTAPPLSSPNPVASPADIATPCPTGTTVVEVGTPMVEAGLSVTLLADELQAGPVDLTIEVADAAGRPVTGAAVTIATQHLEMNHGGSTTEAEAAAPGRYVAERVAMGMGGTWQAEVIVEQPGKTPVDVTFRIVLEGPH
ncbi:MAG: FixH family protein [Chloroflexota bacterium]|nr:FixH family protein [Chloroflexota bacterium]